MKSIKIKNLRFLDSDLRLDASYHLSDGSIAKVLLEKSPYQTIKLSQACDRIFSGNIFRRTYVESEQKGWPYLTGSDMVKSDINSHKYLSKKYTDQADNLAIKKDWILISCSGTLGNCAFTNDIYEGRVGTHDLIRAIPNNKDVKRGFLFAYLSSKYGNGLLTQSSYGGVVKHIEPHHVSEVPVPIFPESLQHKINNLIIQANELRVEANDLIDSADSQFHDLNELAYSYEEICASENAMQIGNIVKHGDLFKTTIKARNHSSRANGIMSKWSSKQGFKITDILTPEGLTRGMGGFFKRTTDKNVKGMDIISQGDIHDRKPVFKQIIKKGVKESEIARKGMIIFPAAGTLGENEIFLRPQMIYKNFEGKVLSEVVGKLRPINIEESAYLFAALRSVGGFRILRAMVYGTNLMYPNWELLKNLHIPCKDEKTKRTVSKLIIDYYEKTSMANEKETIAIDLVEKEIESWQK